MMKIYCPVFISTKISVRNEVSSCTEGNTHFLMGIAGSVYTAFIPRLTQCSVSMHVPVSFPGSGCPCHSSVCELGLCWEMALAAPGDIQCFLTFSIRTKK